MTVGEKVAAANRKVLDIMTKARLVWTDVKPAIEAVPGMERNLILIPGPPIEPEDLPVPLKTSVCGAAIHDGLAKSMEEAWEMVLKREIRIGSSQNYNCGNAASSVMSSSMPVFVVEDKTSGGTGYCVPHPGSNPRVLRWGIYGDDVEENLSFIRGDYAAVLGEAVRKSGGIDLIRILSRTAGMGDENHNRQPAASMALALELVPYLLDVDHPARDRVIKEVCANDRFFLHVMMAGVEAVMQSCKKVPYSTVMVGMGGNGIEFGIQIAGTGNRWYTTEAPKISGIFLKPTTTEADLLGYLGDSCVTEVWGLGGMSAIAGPSYLRMTGGTFRDAQERTEKARQVSLGEHTFAPVPWDDYRGFPVGVDVRKVVGMNVLPISHGGSALKTGGQAGAGAAELPMVCFREAVEGLVEEIKKLEGE
ncbi:MAG: DUF1116 domain-containing protein [Erysipelotrichaceae bacterium]|nr:DUF1116 domain-containing protein [Erysipelotrichaceae bacterium]